MGTNEVRRLSSSSNGSFTALDLDPVLYKVEVEMKGFKKSVVENVKVDTGSTTTLNVTLQAGAVETLFILGGNPVYTAPADFSFAESLSKVKRSIHLSQHLVKELARLSQTSHEPTGLFLIRIQSKLKRSHILIIAIRERNINSFIPSAGGNSSP